MLMKISRTLLSALVVSVLVGGVYGVKNARGRTAEEPIRNMMAAPKATGNASAAVRVVEFIDYQCPSCAKSSYFLHELAKRHPNDLYIEVKYFPLRGHAHSMTSAKLVECSRMQGKFWPAHQAVFLSQASWRDLADARPVLRQAAEAAGVDLAQIDRCEADPATERNILADRDEGVRLALKSTPTFFINGTMVVGFQAMSTEMTRRFPDAVSIVLPADNVASPVAAAPAAPAAGTDPHAGHAH